MAERTPGDWRLGMGIYAGIIHAHTKDGDMRTVGSPYYYGTDAASISEAQANGRLMAAAPDLLAVCERIMAKDGVAGLRGELQAAVAKARGE